MKKGLSNFQIDDLFKDEENEELKNNYVGTYSIDSITKYINFYEITRRRNGKYPFAIFNTDKHTNPGTHWRSFMDIHPKNNLFLFDSLGLEGFKVFVVNSKEDIIDQLPYDFSKCKLKLNQKRYVVWNFVLKLGKKCNKKQKIN